MISLIADGSAGSGGSNATLWILLVLLAVLIVAYIFSYVKRKKYNQETANMLNNLKPGDKVKTYSGFYGTVVSIRETTDGKVVTLETGDDEHKSYTTIDSNAIYCIDKKEDIVYDMDGNVVMPASEEEKQEATDSANLANEEDAAKDKAETVNTEAEQTSESEEPKEDVLAAENTETTTDANVVVEEAPTETKKPRKKRSSSKK